ncbi:MAG: hypothetical protein Kapaf2KO_02180 [Candidatus Kapaibacteriales bacterium]
MNNLMSMLMYSCRELSEMVERRKIEPIGSIEKLKMDLHKMICKNCRQYEIHSDQIDELVEQLMNSEFNLNQPVENGELKRNIKENTTGIV